MLEKNAFMAFVVDAASDKMLPEWERNGKTWIVADHGRQYYVKVGVTSQVKDPVKAIVRVDGRDAGIEVIMEHGPDVSPPVGAMKSTSSKAVMQDAFRFVCHPVTGAQEEYHVSQKNVGKIEVVFLCASYVGCETNPSTNKGWVKASDEAVSRQTKKEQSRMGTARGDPMQALGVSDEVFADGEQLAHLTIHYASDFALAQRGDFYTPDEVTADGWKRVKTDEGSSTDKAIVIADDDEEAPPKRVKTEGSLADDKVIVLADDDEEAPPKRVKTEPPL
jgi:hypothetical protein